MKCTDLEEILSAYANGELARTQREFVEDHIAGCQACRNLLADYLDVKNKLSRLQTAPEADITQATMSRIRQQSRVGQRGPVRLRDFLVPVFRQWRWGIAAGGILVMALTITLCVSILTSDGRQSNIALAREIASNSPMIKMANMTEGATIIQGVDLQSPNAAIVNFSASNGNQIAAEVDLEQKKVKLLEIKFPGSELTEAEKTLAIAIAEADHRIIEFLNQGMSIQMIHQIPLDGVGKIIDLLLFPEIILPDDKDQNGLITIKGKSVRVDIGARKILSINNGTIVMPLEITTPVPELTEAEKTLATEIARADPRVTEFLNEGMIIQDIHQIPLVGAGKIIDVVLWSDQPMESGYIQGKSVRVDIGKKAVLTINDGTMIPGFLQP